MVERLGDAAIEPEYIDLMNGIAHVFDEAFNGNTKGADRM